MKTFAPDVKAARLELLAVAGLLITSLVLPFLFHLIPYQGDIPLGASFLPIYYAPLLGMILFGRRAGLITGILSPVINKAVTGMPAGNMLPVLSAGLVLFLVIYSIVSDKVNIVKGKAYLEPAKVVISYALSVIICIAFGLRPYFVEADSYFPAVISAMSISFPGVIFLSVIAYAARKHEVSHD